MGGIWLEKWALLPPENTLEPTSALPTRGYETITATVRMNRATAILLTKTQAQILSATATHIPTFNTSVTVTVKPSISPTWYFRYPATLTPFRIPMRIPTRTLTPQYRSPTTPPATPSKTPTPLAIPSKTPTRTVTSLPTRTAGTADPLTAWIGFSVYSGTGGFMGIQKMRANGSDLTALINGPDAANDALLCDWNTDGSQMVFERGAPHQLYLANADGTGQVLLPNLPVGENIQAAWSPNGTWLVFRNNSAASVDLYLYHLPSQTAYPLTANADVASDPSWSADGRQIVFVKAGDVYTLQVGGLSLPLPVMPQAVQVTKTDGVESSPRFSPDGSKLVYDRDGEIFSRTLSNGTEVNLSNNVAVDSSPIWSRDGSWIAFLSERDGQGDLYRMRADGSQVTRISSISAAEVRPRWQP